MASSTRLPVYKKKKLVKPVIYLNREIQRRHRNAEKALRYAAASSDYEVEQPDDDDILEQRVRSARTASAVGQRSSTAINAVDRTTTTRPTSSSRAATSTKTVKQG
jgi:hypothetical protein